MQFISGIPVQVLLSQTLIILGSLCRVTTQDTFLFAVSAGLHPAPPGLYGAAIDHSHGYSRLRSYFDFRYGYQCLATDGPQERGIELSEVAYDHVSGQVLLVKKTNDKQQLTAYRGHVCQDGGCSANQQHYDGNTPEGCSRGICHFKQPNRVMTTVFDNFRFSLSEPTPMSFGFHDGEIYFVSQYRHNVGLRQVQNVIELRRLSGCDDLYPASANTAFEIEDCSELLATLADEQRQYASYQPMAGVRIQEIDGELFIFLTLKRLNFLQEESSDYDTVYVGLHVIVLGPDRRTMLHKGLLWEEDVGRDYQPFIIDQLGNIDYRNNKLCWSTIDRIICADFLASQREVKYDRRAVTPGQGAEVCTGNDFYSKIVTGVAIADVTHEYISLFFGCMSGLPGVGGTGFARFHHYEFHTKAHFQSIGNVSTDTPMFSGQLFLTNKCRYPDPTSSDPPHIIDHGTGADPSTGKSTQGCGSLRCSYAVLVFLLTLVACQ